MLSVWVKTDDRWRLLAITNDPVSLELAQEAIPGLAVKLVDDLGVAPGRAEGLIPIVGVPDSEEGDRFGVFRWWPSLSAGVLAEMAEFHYDNASRFFLQPGGELSAGNLWSTGSPWSWRIWTIGLDGQVVLSVVGRFEH